jgi:hypothetical protein
VRRAQIYLSRPLLIAAVLMDLFLAAGIAVGGPTDAAVTAAPSAAAMAEYRRLLADYLKARAAFDADNKTYWTSISQMRKLRYAKRASRTPVVLDDYVLTQPPVYTGPPQPVNPAAPKKPPAPRVYVPVVADFLNAAKQEFNFIPRQPQTDLDFKRAYAKVASAAGLTANQAVRVYAFEATGNGTYDVQAGLEYNTPTAHAITTALGYNQLLSTNSVELMAEVGNQFVTDLNAKAAQLSGDEKSALLSKIAVVQKMVAFATSVPDDWSQHELLANTPKGLGIHAMNLDVDVGPMLQTQKLLISVLFARSHGYAAALTAAELEMMNLTGDGSGFDIVTMPQEWREQVPTSNFFQPNGYQDNPVAQRNNVVAKLIAATNTAMDEEAKKKGAKDLAAAFAN